MTGFGWKAELNSIWAEEEHWDDLLSDPKNKTDYQWFRTHTCHWAPDIEELLGPRLATGKYAYTSESARIAAANAINSNPKQRPLDPFAEDDDFGSYTDQFGNIMKELFPDGTVFPGDPNYKSSTDPFTNIFGPDEPTNQQSTPSAPSATPKPTSTTPSQLQQVNALKRPRAKASDTRTTGKRTKLSAGASLSGATGQIADVMGDTLSWRKEEFLLNRPIYQRALDIIHSTCQKYVDRLEWKEQMAIPSYLNHVPSMLGETTHSIAHFIVDAQEGPARTKFIKYTLRDIPNYLEKCTVQSEAASRRNGTLGEDEEYVRISDAEPEESDGSGDEALESIVSGAEEEADE